MIRHIVFFSARDASDREAIKSGLQILAKIPHSSHFEVSFNQNIDPLCDAIDVVVYAEFEDQEALLAYKADPLYAEATREVKPLRDLRYSADFIAA
ncbi:Dabb family protein [Mesorhizobium sp. NBSH29]|uniref:Dabb family protein n=1 Tax=Mesorhizobium sp. NBSH29 TaxID=2654249 RepID=UPI0018964740|nr:Dabb family protein [Mesorhizobium sp. NBSH29]QPC87541.1 Dabb family protein [Mesorhizobium sp. NBSH29]